MVAAVLGAQLRPALRDERLDSRSDLAGRAENHALQGIKITRVKRQPPAADRLVIQFEDILQNRHLHLRIVKPGQQHPVGGMGAIRGNDLQTLKSVIDVDESPVLGLVEGGRLGFPESVSLSLPTGKES